MLSCFTLQSPGGLTSPVGGMPHSQMQSPTSTMGPPPSLGLGGLPGQPGQHGPFPTRHICAICGDRASGKHYGVYRYVWRCKTSAIYMLFISCNLVLCMSQKIYSSKLIANKIKCQKYRGMEQRISLTFKFIKLNVWKRFCSCLVRSPSRKVHLLLS